MQEVQTDTFFIFGQQGSGDCSIYEVSYDFDFPGITVGDNLNTLPGCFALSNEITIVKNSLLMVDGGSITTPLGDSLHLCQTDIVTDTIQVTLSDQEGSGSAWVLTCLLYTSPSPRDATLSRMPSSA